MKEIHKFLIVALSIFLFSTVRAQSPDAFKYQAVVRDNTGALIINQSISFRLSILSGSSSGTIEFSETHVVATNSYGVANLEIGNGSVLSGDISTLDWSSNLYFIQVELDLNGGSSYTILGTSQLLSVPYALNAKFVENDEVDDADSDPSNEIQNISKSGNTITLSNGGGNIIDEVDDADNDSTNELQTISRLGNTITLSNGGGSIMDEVNDSDNDSTNENQTLSISGNNLSISNGNSVLIPSSNIWTQSGTNISYDQGNVGIGFTTNPTHLLQIGNGIDNTVLRLTGGLGSTNYGARLNFGDGNLVYLEEDSDNDLTIFSNRLQLKALKVDIGTDSALSGAAGRLNLDGNLIGIGSNGNRKYLLELGLDSIGSGRIRTFGPNGQVNAAFTSFSNQNFGAISVYNDFGDQKAWLGVSPLANAGLISVIGPNGNNNVSFSYSSADANIGWIGVRNPSGSDLVRITGGSSGTGIIGTLGPNGSNNVTLTALGTNANNGYVVVYDSSSTFAAGVFVDNAGDGIIVGDVKNFRMEHPTRQGKEIWYASLEGPEAGAYCRGTATLQNGEIQVPLPDHFTLAANVKDMTVTLTPLSANSKGLAVIAKEEGYVSVKELGGGQGNYDFDWEVKSVRKGYENYKVVRNAEDWSPKSLINTSGEVNSEMDMKKVEITTRPDSD